MALLKRKNLRKMYRGQNQNSNHNRNYNTDNRYHNRNYGNNNHYHSNNNRNHSNNNHYHGHNHSRSNNDYNSQNNSNNTSSSNSYNRHHSNNNHYNRNNYNNHTGDHDHTSDNNSSKPIMYHGIPMYEDKRKIANETLDIIRNRSYTINRNTINIKNEIDQCVRLTKVYLSKEEADIRNIQPKAALCKFEITVESTLEAAKRILEMNIADVAVLNFASATKPGGGWLNGRDAQEETITRQSALYLSISSREPNEKFYVYHADILKSDDPEKNLYTDTIIYSPKVPVIRDSNKEELLTRPFLVSFITSAATNLSLLIEDYQKSEKGSKLPNIYTDDKKPRSDSNHQTQSSLQKNLETSNPSKKIIVSSKNQPSNYQQQSNLQKSYNQNNNNNNYPAQSPKITQPNMQKSSYNSQASHGPVLPGNYNQQQQGNINQPAPRNFVQPPPGSYNQQQGNYNQQQQQGNINQPPPRNYVHPPSENCSQQPSRYYPQQNQTNLANYDQNQSSNLQRSSNNQNPNSQFKPSLPENKNVNNNPRTSFNSKQAKDSDLQKSSSDNSHPISGNPPTNLYQSHTPGNNPPTNLYQSHTPGNNPPTNLYQSYSSGNNPPTNSYQNYNSSSNMARHNSTNIQKSSYKQPQQSSENQKNGKGGKNDEISALKAKNLAVMQKRCEKIIKVCIANKNKAIVLGAFGCGIFGNDPSEIANIFYNILVTQKLGNYLDCVVFAFKGAKVDGYTFTSFKKKFSTDH